MGAHSMLSIYPLLFLQQGFSSIWTLYATIAYFVWTCILAVKPKANHTAKRQVSIESLLQTFCDKFACHHCGWIKVLGNASENFVLDGDPKLLKTKFGRLVDQVDTAKYSFLHIQKGLRFIFILWQ